VLDLSNFGKKMQGRLVGVAFVVFGSGLHGDHGALQDSD